MGFVPDEGKDLPPPGFVNRYSVYIGGVSWFSAILHNALLRRPALKSGAPKQLLFLAVGWYMGYHFTRYENYYYAKVDREMNHYVQLHPEYFPPKEEKTYAEIVTPFQPVR